VHGHLGLLDLSILQADAREPLGQGLDEIDGLPLDHGDQPLRQHSIVDGTRQIIARRGRAQIKIETYVHDELLAEFTLGGKHAVPPPCPQSEQLNPVFH
jgi:hypothetical protein